MNKQEAIEEIKDTLAAKTAESIHAIGSPEGMVDIIMHMRETKQAIEIMRTNHTKNLAIMFSDGSVLLVRKDKDGAMEFVPLFKHTILRILDGLFPFEELENMVVAKQQEI